VEKSKREARQARLTESATSRWLSGSMKASLMLDYADGTLPSPVTAARYLSDLSEELGDVVSLSGGTIGDRLATARKEREEVFASLPKPMSALYSRIGARIRDGVAVAEARNRSCSACFMSLRPQMMSEIRRGDEIITCDNCGRILYVAPPAEPVKADAATTQPNVAVS